MGTKIFRPKYLIGGEGGGPQHKIKFGRGGGGAKFKGRPKILGGGGAMNLNDAMAIVLKDILLCLLGFRFI